MRPNRQEGLWMKAESGHTSLRKSRKQTIMARTRRYVKGNKQIPTFWWRQTEGRGVKVGQLLLLPPPPLMETVSVSCESGGWAEGRRVRGVEPVSQSWLGISPRASLFRCAPRLSLTPRRSQICHIRAVAQTLTALCDCLSRVTLITLLIETRLKEVDEVVARKSRPATRPTSAWSSATFS